MNYGKLSTTLSSLLYEFTQIGPAMNPPVRRPLRRPQGCIFAGTDLQEVSVFIHCDEDADFTDLSGVDMYTNTGTVRTARIDFRGSSNDVIQRLTDLCKMDKVHYVSSSMRLKPLNDVAAVKTGLAGFRTSHGQLNGQGVIIGIIDSGIDASHPAFAGRIHSIWDQTLPGTAGNVPRYGQILTGANMAQSEDIDGHGTHVAGIATGFDTPFGGVAPGADIVVVKTDFQTAHIADAIRHIFDIAASLNKPAVINLSAGGQLDAHDGTDDLSRFIPQELKDKAGRIIVAAAGNEGDKEIHARVTVPHTPVEAPFVIGLELKHVEGPKRPKQLVVRGWHDKNADCIIRLVNPTGAAADTSLGPRAIGLAAADAETAKRLIYDVESDAYVAKSLVPCFLNDSSEFFIDSRTVTLLERGRWTLEIENHGPDPLLMDLWVWVSEGVDEPEFEPEFNSPAVKIGSPGSAGGAITVASYTTRTDGISFAVDTLSTFSSPGPLRDGGLKPDVAAPAAVMISAHSSKAPPLVLTVIRNGFTTGAGTSMAAAFITGICALLLQNNPALTPPVVKGWLQSNSRIPGRPPGQHDERWGYGLLDLRNVDNLP